MPRLKAQLHNPASKAASPNARSMRSKRPGATWCAPEQHIVPCQGSARGWGGQSPAGNKASGAAKRPMTKSREGFIRTFEPKPRWINRFVQIRAQHLGSVRKHWAGLSELCPIFESDRVDLLP